MVNFAKHFGNVPKTTSEPDGGIWFYIGHTRTSCAIEENMKIKRKFQSDAPPPDSSDFPYDEM